MQRARGNETAAMAAKGKGTAMAADRATLADKWMNQGEGRVIARPTRIRHTNRRFVGPEEGHPGLDHGLVQVAAGQSGTAQAQVAYGSAFNNLPAQTTQAYGMPYAYANPMAMAGYQDVQASGHAGYPIASYDQNAIPCYTIYAGYPAGYDQNGFPYYTGYPAGHDQNAMHFYLVAYAATAVGVPATNAANMDGHAGPPAGAGQAESMGDATVHITLASGASPVAAISSPPLEM
ncbi:hypothetical protein ACQJBY_059087 [Aegilops geniculata]